MATNFREMLEAQWAKGKFVCVGLDSDPTKIPECVRKGSNDTASMLAFNLEIIDATKDIVLAYKPNLAFYLAYGNIGINALWRTITYIHDVAPDVPVKIDAKFADIGNTNNGYVRYAFDVLRADAATANPYLGAEAMKPFLDRKDKGIIVLCRTSNPGANEFQDLPISLDPESHRRFERHVGREVPGWSIPLYQYVAYRVATQWNANGNCGLVVGATVPDELAEVRAIVGDMPILIPGIGAQGGDLEATIKAGKDSRGRGMIINSSRGIIFASDGEDFAEAARRETQKLNDQIQACLNL